MFQESGIKARHPVICLLTAKTSLLSVFLGAKANEIT